MVDEQWKGRLTIKSIKELIQHTRQLKIRNDGGWLFDN